MTSVAVSIDLAQSVEDVWGSLSQLERHSEWMSDAERIDFLSDQRRGVGTAMKVRTRVGPFVTTDVIVVEKWVEQRCIGVTHRGFVYGEGVFSLEPTPTGTRFTWHEAIRFPWYLGGAATTVLALPVLSHIWNRNLERFAASLT